MRPLRRDTLGGAHLLHRLLGADAHELGVAARREGQAALVEMRDRLHGAVEQAAIVAHDDASAGEAGEPALEPHRRLKVEVVGGLVE